MGSAVAEVVAERGIACRVTRLGVPDRFPEMGIPEDLVQRLGFDEDGILGALAALREMPPDGDEDWEDRF